MKLAIQKFLKITERRGSMYNYNVVITKATTIRDIRRISVVDTNYVLRHRDRIDRAQAHLIANTRSFNFIQNGMFDIKPPANACYTNLSKNAYVITFHWMFAVFRIP